MQTSIDWMAKVADACQEGSGDILPSLDSLSAARDMDVLRAAVGDESLNYLGFSYGTYLGSLYADTYPERVGRFVLDGVMDPPSISTRSARGRPPASRRPPSPSASSASSRRTARSRGRRGRRSPSS